VAASKQGWFAFNNSTVYRRILFRFDPTSGFTGETLGPQPCGAVVNGLLTGPILLHGKRAVDFLMLFHQKARFGTLFQLLSGRLWRESAAGSDYHLRQRTSEQKVASAPSEGINSSVLSQRLIRP
jgi:hypothetical protein